MTVLRLTYNDDTKLDVRPSDVVEISAQSRYDSDPAVVVEADAGPRDNYRYLATNVEFVNREPDTNVPLQ